jgi:hypothetical protein
MSIFGDLKSDGLEQTQDRIGGYQPFDSDFYTGTIKAAYAGQSSGGARSMTYIVEADGREYRETVYVTNKKGENFFLNQQDKTKKVPLPGFVVAEDIALVTVEKTLSELTFEDKVMNVYDAEAGREVPKSVPMAVELLGKQVGLGIIRQLENKSVKDGQGNYQPTADTRETNFIDKVFHHPTNITVVEARNGLQEAKFHAAWVERNKGQTRDKRVIKDGGSAGTAGAPGGAQGGAPQAGGGTVRKSLFGG